MDRAEELAHAWQSVCHDVAESCRRHERSPDGVTIIAVTKGFPASDVIHLANAGVTDVGESRDQEARAKRDQGLAAKVHGLTWHAIGQVQTNKASHVAQWADMVHSVDRARLVLALAAAAAQAQHPLPVLIQVRGGAHGTTAADGRAGVAAEHFDDLVDMVLAQPALALRGLMTVAEIGEPAGAQFEDVARLWRRLRLTHPGADVFSAGMSGDFDAAISAGATHLRIGTAILGSRMVAR